MTGANPVAPLADGYTWRARCMRVSERENSTKTSEVGLQINPSRETSVSYVCRNVRLSRKGQAGVVCPFVKLTSRKFVLFDGSFFFFSE